MKDHEDFYRDNFINDQVDLGSMFPDPLALSLRDDQAWQQRRIRRMLFIEVLDLPGEGKH